MDLALSEPRISTGKRFEFSAGGMQWAPVSGTVSNRFLVSYRMAAHALAALVPSPFTLDAYEGYGFLSVCAVEILDMGIHGLPRPLRFDNREFLYRLGVRLRGEPTFITLRSDVSSRALACLGRHFSHYRPQLANVSLRRSGGRVQLECTSCDGGGDATLDAEMEPLLEQQGSLFPSPEAAAGFLLGMAFSADVRHGRVRVQPIDHDPWQPRFVRVASARFGFLEHLEQELGARLIYDNTLASSGIHQIWRAARWL